MEYFIYGIIATLLFLFTTMVIWTKGRIFKYMYYATIYFVMRIFGHNPFM